MPSPNKKIAKEKPVKINMSFDDAMKKALSTPIAKNKMKKNTKKSR